MTGYTLPELLVVVALLGILTATALTLMKFRSAVEVVRLRSDVTVANSAAAAYRTGGGSLDALDAAGAVAKMKSVTTADGGNDREIPFLRQSFIDRRLKPVMGQGTPDRPAAVWSPERQRFEFTTNGPGIVRFDLADAAALASPVAERRETTFRHARTAGWVWDFADVSPAADKPVPAEPQSTPLEAPPASTPGGPPSPGRLLPPLLDRPPGRYPLKDYPVQVSVYDPNPPADSALYWRRAGAAWMNGENLASDTLDPATEVQAVAVARDPLAWSDSGVTAGEYSAIEVRPMVRAVFDRTHYSYIEAGGALMEGDYEPAAPVASGAVQLVNPSEIPLRYQNSANFRPAWTVDGSDPFDSPTASHASDFANGFPGQAIPVSLALWGAASVATVRAGCPTYQPLMFLDGSAVTTTLGIDPLTLAEPRIDAGAGTVRGGSEVSMALEVDGGDVPVGARIFYTTDGSDPADADENDEPDRGAEYRAVLKAPLINGDWKLTARVYAPNDFKPWFRTSGATVRSLHICTELATQATASAEGLSISVGLLGSALLPTVQAGFSTGVAPAPFTSGSSAAANASLGINLLGIPVSLVASAGIANTVAASDLANGATTCQAASAATLTRAGGFFTLDIVDLPKILLIDAAPVLRLQADVISSQSTVARDGTTTTSSGQTQLSQFSLVIRGSTVIPLATLLGGSTAPAPNTGVDLGIHGLAGVRLVFNEQQRTASASADALRTTAVAVYIDGLSILPGAPALTGSVKLGTSIAQVTHSVCP